MKIKRADERGFAALEVLIIVVVVAVLGFAGWYVWQSMKPAAQKATTTINTRSNTSQTQTKPTPTIQTTTYSKVPAQLQTAIYSYTAAKVPGCVKDGKPVDISGSAVDPKVTYLEAAYAITGVGCDSPAATLFAYADTTWQEVAATQFAFKCETLAQYHVSKEFLTTATGSAMCIDASDNTVAYPGA